MAVRKSSKKWAVGDPVRNSRLEDINTDLESALSMTARGVLMETTGTQINACDATTGWVASGVATAVAVDTARYVEGTGSFKMGASGAGTATYVLTVGSTNMSTAKKFRMSIWRGLSFTSTVTSVTVRIGSDSSNYYYWTLSNSTDKFGKWYEEVLNQFTGGVSGTDRSGTTGSPNMAAVTYFAVVIVTSGVLSNSNCLIDDIRWAPLGVDILGFGYMIGSTQGFKASTTNLALTASVTDKYLEISTAGVIAESATQTTTKATIAKFTTDANQITALTTYSQVIVGGELGAVTKADVQSDTYKYAADTGSANAYVVTLSPVLGAYSTGQMIYFKAANACTGASTLNVNSLGAKTIKFGGNDLYTGDIKAGDMIAVMYDGTNFNLVAVNFNNALDQMYFGNGSDGNVTIASGTTTLAADMYYKNLTISAGAILKTNGWRVFVQDTLTNAGTIRNNGNDGTSAVSHASGGAGGTTSANSGTLAGTTAGSAGGDAAHYNSAAWGGSGGGGGASGGVILIMARKINNTGTIEANGGNGGNGANADAYSAQGSAGVSATVPSGSNKTSVGSNGSNGGAGGANSTYNPSTSQNGGTNTSETMSYVFLSTGLTAGSIVSLNKYKLPYTSTNGTALSVSSGACGGGGGGAGAYSSGGGGGAGGNGGTIVLIYKDLTAGTIQALGGSPGNGGLKTVGGTNPTCYDGSAGSSGSAGKIFKLLIL